MPRYGSIEAPVLTLESDLMLSKLVQVLNESAGRFEKTCLKYHHFSPETLLVETDAYIIAVTTELIFMGSVNTYDFSSRLSNSVGLFDATNFDLACSLVAKTLDQSPS
jgi:hypothetical protein